MKTKLEVNRSLNHNQQHAKIAANMPACVPENQTNLTSVGVALSPSPKELLCVQYPITAVAGSSFLLTLVCYGPFT